MSATGSYGDHPTKYADQNDLDFYANFRQETWSQLDESGRQELLQEAVNRSAAQHGELGSCKVVFADLKPGTCGVQSGDTIKLNREMYVNDRQVRVVNGEEMYQPLADSNMRALTTVFHEDEHAYQNQVTAGLIPAEDAEAARQYASNDFTNVILMDESGDIKVGNTYLQGLSETPDHNTGYILYYLQSSERDAHKFSEEKTAAIMNALEEKFGSELSFEAYKIELEANGYDSTLTYAQELTQIPDIEQEINKSLMNHYYGTNEPVNPYVEALVQKEMILSHDAMVRHQNELEQDTEHANEENTAKEPATETVETDESPKADSEVSNEEETENTEETAEAIDGSGDAISNEDAGVTLDGGVEDTADTVEEGSVLDNVIEGLNGIADETENDALDGGIGDDGNGIGDDDSGGVEDDDGGVEDDDGGVDDDDGGIDGDDDGGIE